MLMTRCEPFCPPTITRRALLKGSVATLLAGTSLRGALAQADELRVGVRAPPVTLVTVDGARISSADLVGSVVLLTFWATWCAPCRDELPLLSRYAAQHAAAGLRVFGIQPGYA